MWVLWDRDWVWVEVRDWGARRDWERARKGGWIRDEETWVKVVSEVDSLCLG